jgi:hypothetical protein
VESEESFHPTLPTTASTTDVQSAVDEEDEEQEEAGGEGEGEGDGGDESSESGETYDSEDNEGEEGDGGEGQEAGEAGNEDAEQSEETTPEGEVEGSATSDQGTAAASAHSPAPLYKLPGGSKHRAPHTHHAPKAPHTNSGTTVEAPTFKVTSNSRYQKGGGSWIKNDSPGGTLLGALSNTPAKGHHQPKQIIPTSDSKQPLARRHSSMINQCKCDVIVYSEVVFDAYLLVSGVDFV